MNSESRIPELNAVFLSMAFKRLYKKASGGRESAVSAPAKIADALPRSGKQGADAPRSRNDRAAPAGRGEFLYSL